MNVIQQERELVRKMLIDEAWYEGERRGEFVPTSDFGVVSRVLAILERDGARLFEYAQLLARSA